MIPIYRIIDFFLQTSALHLKNPYVSLSDGINLSRKSENFLALKTQLSYGSENAPLDAISRTKMFLNVLFH